MGVPKLWGAKLPVTQVYQVSNVYKVSNMSNMPVNFSSIRLSTCPLGQTLLT